MKNLVLATRNRGKLVEIRDLLDIPDVKLTSLADWAGAPNTDESGATFEENAVLKAVDAAKFTGQIALADDSGLCVDALGGAPGVLSARYGGPGLDDVGRYRALLEALRDVPDAERGARFVCVVALAKPDGEVHTEYGEIEGVIAREPAGSSGFGYDPVFFVPKMGCTVAQLSTVSKNEVSHRAIAIRKAAPIIRGLLNA